MSLLEGIQEIQDRLEVLKEDNNGTVTEYCLGVQDTVDFILGKSEQPNF